MSNRGPEIERIDSVEQQPTESELIIPAGDGVQLTLLKTADTSSFLALIDRNRDHLRPMSARLADLNAADARGMIERGQQRFSAHTDLQMGIRREGELVGHASVLHLGESQKTPELGFWLGESFEGSGIVSRAAVALIDYVKREYGATEIAMTAAPDNDRSIAFATRNGFKYLEDRDGEHYYTKTLKQ